MAVASKSKIKNSHSKKAVAAHHHHGKHYIKSYWPYLPVALLLVAGWQFGLTPWHHPAYGVAMLGFAAFAVLI